MNVLVTGGAGYIGSHMVRTLQRAGHHPVVLDSLVTGHRSTVPTNVPFVHADVRDTAAVMGTLAQYEITAVMHFAARIQVGESVTHPGLYWRDNLAATISLIESITMEGVQRVIFSSTAAVYGTPEYVPIDERHPTRPENPYGATKLATERMLADHAAAGALSYVALRYFNAAGADPMEPIGEQHDPETHLIPLVIAAAQGTRASLDVFGNDWPTPDGTCVRDYVHVCDLARAHLAALQYLDAGGPSDVFNLGTGQGYSVREVISAVERVTKRTVPVRDKPRRPGDSSSLVANPTKAQAVLHWKAQRSSLDEIILDAWKWHSQSGQQ